MDSSRYESSVQPLVIPNNSWIDNLNAQLDQQFPEIPKRSI